MARSTKSSPRTRRPIRWKSCSGRWTTPSRGWRSKPAAWAAPPTRCRWRCPTDRQFALALRWLVDFADARKGIPMKEALAAEILEAYQGQGNAIRKRDEVHKMAQANKAFAHFRW